MTRDTNAGGRGDRGGPAAPPAPSTTVTRTTSVDHVRVGPHCYTVEPDDRIGQREAKGETYVDRCAIVYDADQHPSQLRETLLHEVLHAIWALTGLRVDEDTAEHEELVVASLAPGLLGVLRDNPALLEFLLADTTVASDTKPGGSGGSGVAADVPALGIPTTTTNGTSLGGCGG